MDKRAFTLLLRSNRTCLVVEIAFFGNKNNHEQNNIKGEIIISEIVLWVKNKAKLCHCQLRKDKVSKLCVIKMEIEATVLTKTL